MSPLPSPHGFVSTKEAAKTCGYSADYLARLARSGEVRGMQSGRAWLVDPESLAGYLEDQQRKKRERLDELSRSRAREYQAHQGETVPVRAAPVLSPQKAVLRPVAAKVEMWRAVAPIPSLLSVASLRQASWQSKGGALVAACAVIAAGAFVGDTPLLHGTGTRTLAVLELASNGFTDLVEPMRESIGGELAALHRGGSYTHQDLAIITVPVGQVRAPPPPVPLESASTTQADLTSNQAVKLHLEDPLSAIASLPGEFARAVHGLIGGEVALAYAMPTVAGGVSQIAVGAAGALGNASLALTKTGSREARYVAGAALQSPVALVSSIRELASSIRVPRVPSTAGLASVHLPSLKLPSIHIHTRIDAGHALASVYGGAWGGVVSVASHTGRAVLSVKNTLKNIVSPARLATSAGSHGPTQGQVAAVDVATATSTTNSPPQGLGSDIPTPIPGSEGLPVVVAVPISAETVSYGDLIDYDPATGLYTPSTKANDPAVYGVAVEHPSVLLAAGNTGIPVLERGRALVNVTLENGPISEGDAIAASSIPGKGMKAAPGSAVALGIAREAFTGIVASSTSPNGGAELNIGTIMVDVTVYERQAIAEGGCSGGRILCVLASKVNATPLVSLMRYLIAAAIALGALYLAFRTFMADAVSGVISVGRNPRAKASIQAMVIFNGVLAVCIALAGLASALVILFIKI